MHKHEPVDARAHAFTVDVEDWYHGIPIADSRKLSAEHRLDVGMDRLLDMLDRHSVHGTFFFLGPIARANPGLVRRVADAGHELGCHGWAHQLVYTMTPDEFREDTRRAAEAIADATGIAVRAYRAPYFSITARSYWALDVLASLGFRYDSSIFPVRNWRYGIPDFRPAPQSIATPSGRIFELPISVRRILGRNVPVSGGAYFRLYPLGITRTNMRAAERLGQGTVFYLHPWELDADHPRVSFYWKARLTHYANLRSTVSKLDALLGEFRFDTLGRVLDYEIANACS